MQNKLIIGIKNEIDLDYWIIFYLNTKHPVQHKTNKILFGCSKHIKDNKLTFLLHNLNPIGNWCHFTFCHFTNQLAELHHEEEGDALTALAQTLKDVGMFKTSAGRKKEQTVK